ncbi:PhoH family protein [Dissulfurirhabdus thermomarina]|uniref:PhoH-like protein n=1 Tax=Dissulfurirhabdus thermomarina TaxID=1765737 RepID=A0A6N9TNA2_DISTH|nr:PhoH family protein [Dissulfurirhabdus thermomarina]NDY42771.1 PhoH family protein [Dissulfurirhabdus thermomarina]NMX24112.1 PhoH family protein [Dissulfurirhabdus thermomarina]
MAEKVRTFEDNQLARALYGEQGRNLHALEEALGVECHVRGNQVTLAGDAAGVELADRAVAQLYGLLREGYPLFEGDVEFAAQILSADPGADLREIFLDKIFISSGRRVVTPKSLAQKAYVDAIRRHDIVFGIGPAGTGKTYLAMAMAVAALVREEAARIVLARPAVEAGERLGFLPGDLAEKVNPYLRPLYDALYDMLPLDRASRLLDRGVIEVAPLAFMRGRTLNEAFVILDEAQNTTSEQMKMFLTRLGYGSKAVITGDVTQIDLPEKQASGLVEAEAILRGVPGIAFIHFTHLDVVRHRLVRRIIQAYEDHEARRGGGRPPGEGAPVPGAG